VETTSPINYVDKLSGKRDFDAEPLLPREYSHPGPVFGWPAGTLVGEGLPDIGKRTPFVRASIGREPDAYFQGNSFLSGSYPMLDEVSLSVVDKVKQDLPFSSFPASLRSVSKINAAIWSDLDGDGSDELIVAGAWTPVLVYSLREGKLIDHHMSQTFVHQHRRQMGNDVLELVFLPDHLGWWTALHVSDLNGDGQPDIVAGNQGLNNLFTASKDQPVELLAADFDKNGSIDPILSYYASDGKRYPDATKDELLGQLAGLKRRYVSYESYADQTLTEVFPEWPKETIHLTANRLETTLYLSQPNGTYLTAQLPIEAQYAPVHTITEMDFNADGHADLLLCGNDSMEKQRWGKADANTGVLLKGDGKGGFAYVPASASGFNLRGDVRSVVMIEDLLLFGIRGSKVVAYKQKRTK
jgi:hypothetical protein